jgi:hypothetical protein
VELLGLVESMLVGQFKRAQSELTRGKIQPITIAGLKKDFELIIFLATLIYMGTNLYGRFRKRIMAGNSYEFELKGL